VAEEICCVVLSLRNEPGLVENVRSLMAQEPRPEIVVANSGGGGAAATLRQAGLDVPVVECEEPLYAGGVCNLGIEATSAPYVCFLAADCIARPGWIAHRLEAHRAGARAVSGALDNVYPNSACATAAFVLLASRRMPHCRPHHRVLYGLSYDRTLFDEHGRFRDDLRDGEDTEFRFRLGSAVDIAWAPGVRSAHRYPTGAGELMRDHYDRGRRARLHDGQGLRRVLAQSAWKWPKSSVAEAWQPRSPVSRGQLLRSLPAVALAVAAHVCGVLRSRLVGRRSADPAVKQWRDILGGLPERPW